MCKVHQFEMQERATLSRPSRLGTRRRKRRQAVSALPEAGASRSGAARAPSLDTEKHLATTVREWSKEQATEQELYREQALLKNQLNSTVHAIWQNHAAAGNEAESLKWEKQWLKLHNCQTEWVGYRAECCKSMTAPRAVPIGCNHRLCPMCCYNRSQKARKRIKTMFDRLTHPAMVTLTVPNTESIRKHDFTMFRQRVRKFIAQHSDWILGGVYSLETTFNRSQKTWHLHAHILVDAASPLPTKKEKITLAGERVYAFTAIKLRFEYDWLRLWVKGWGKQPRKDSSADVRNGETYAFEKWVRLGREMRVKEWRDGAYRPVEGISAEDLARRSEWNARNRRVVDVRPVVDRDGAAHEVLKYITKVAAFSDLPEAVEPFCNAVRGARLIQTFGTWYGVKLEDESGDGEHPEDWGDLTCTCGLNIWARMGVFYRRDVEMDAVGQWHLKAPLNHNSMGTIPRPRIRALDTREEF
jgi:replication protein/transposase-like zinc-binding protein